MRVNATDVNGNVGHDASDAVFTIAGATSVGLTSDHNPSAFGQAVTFTATVTPASATGSVQFKVDGGDVGSPVALAGGVAASAALSSLAVGNHAITAVYAGDPSYATSTGTLERVPKISKPLDGNKPNVRIALVGDQGIGPRAKAVLDLVRSESADFLVVLGDFDYENKPVEWGQMLSQFGRDFPWFAVVGNHDVHSWPAYEAIIAAKQASIVGAQCQGKPGRQASCSYREVQLLLSEIGTLGDRGDDEAFAPLPMQPLAHHLFRLSCRVLIGGVDEIPAGLHVAVQHGMAVRFCRCDSSNG